MTIADREKLASLSSNLWFDYCMTIKDNDEFRSLMHTFDQITGGTLSACKFLLTVKKLLQEQNLQENQS
jgi:hypothetical protein